MREERDVGSYYYERERVRGGAPLCGDDLRERDGESPREIWNWNGARERGRAERRREL